MTTMQNLDTIVSQALAHYIKPYRAKLNIVYGANDAIKRGDLHQATKIANEYMARCA